jgi:hypothetical protein
MARTPKAKQKGLAKSADPFAAPGPELRKLIGEVAPSFFFLKFDEEARKGDLVSLMR